MERAATLVYNEIHSRLQGAQLPIKIFCGIGNNGGDGLVVGRLLLKQNYNVTLYVVNYSNVRSKDFRANYNKIKDISTTWPTLINGTEDFPELSGEDFIIDAIFGIGLNRPLEDWVAQLVKYINKSGAFVVSIDMPSGLFADKTPSKKAAVIKANFTLTFQAPKLVFFLPQSAQYLGDLQVLDIGLDLEYLDKTSVKALLIDKQEAITFYKPRKNFSHKGNYGHSLIIGGSYGKIGSISLTATAALRSGAGLVTIYAPKCGYQILQTVLPEAMVLTDKNDNELSKIEFEIEPDVICFGMGAGTSNITALAFKALLEKAKNPMVIDADGLNILSKEKELLKQVPQNSVLTPHPKELERLMGNWNDDFEKLEKARIFSEKYKLILVIKGAHTITVAGDKLFVNNTGNPGMATAGSGDVLSGVITALISQGYEPTIAAVFGVYLHGRAGDISAEEFSYQGLISGDIAKNIGAAFLDLFKKG
jgi:hydroxyethylthiazole kinase-like uncharacterized protein yjeF